MKLIIDIPEEYYNGIKTIPDRQCDADMLIIKSGTPLPEGHGDLIDRNDLLKHYDSTIYHNGIEERKIHFVQIGYVNDAPTIIEADGGE